MGKPKKSKSAKSVRANKILMELREVGEGISMMDESNSAHQFSVRSKDIQANPEMKDGANQF